MKALILVDIQNDFLPGGALAVPNGFDVIPVANGVQSCFDFVVATQDWHPPNHGSFASNHPNKSPGDVIELDGLEQILWPAHCVQGTPGADFAATLEMPRVAKIFRKGTDPLIDSYSGFYDNGHRKSTGMAEWLRSQGVRDVAAVGLATDYCVKFTALDALREGFGVSLIADGCRGVELHEGDVAAAVDQMKSAGVKVIASEALRRNG